MEWAAPGDWRKEGDACLFCLFPKPGMLQSMGLQRVGHD